MEPPVARCEFWPSISAKEKYHAGHTRLGGTPKPGSARSLRRDRHRRRNFRHVYALPTARTGHDRAGFRGRHERRRHLVDPIEECSPTISRRPSFIGLGGNFVRAVPDWPAAEAAMLRLRLTVAVSTKLSV